MESGTITSLRELQQMMPRIIKEHGQNGQLTLLALANPIYALEKAGFSFTKEAREEIELRIRFGKENAARVKETRMAIFEATGKPFDLDSVTELKKNITPLLPAGESASDQKEQKAYHASIGSSLFLKALEEKVRVEKGNVIDPLAAYQHTHPVVQKLIEYRRLAALHPALANASTAEKLVRQNDKLPLKNIRFRMSRKAKKVQ
jgi:hypothetical protein